ncbi:hypothetical protein MJO28_002641, partial [Puccinia striiformis f. sp. tritici]
ILFQTGNPDYVKYTGSLGGVSRAIGAIWNQAGIRGLSLPLFCLFSFIYPVPKFLTILVFAFLLVETCRIFPDAGIKFMTYDILHKSLKRVKRQQVKDL